jgi:hypothetical protein
MATVVMAFILPERRAAGKEPSKAEFPASERDGKRRSVIQWIH